MCLVETICDMARRENHMGFVRMMQRDILRVVDAVAPSDGSGAANVKVVRTVRFYDYIDPDGYTDVLYNLGLSWPPAKTVSHP